MKHEKYFIYNFKIIHFYKERIFTLNKYLNAKEYDIFSTILHSEEPLNVSQIIELHPEMTANIVQPSIRKLIKLNLVEVADITLDGNIFSRRFKPTVILASWYPASL